MVDKNNLIKSWVTTKCEELFGSINLAGTLLGWCSKGEDLVLLKIPVKSLDKSKLKFRPYIESCKAGFAGDTAALQGLHIKELSQCKDKMSPLEYVYKGEIPMESISVESVTPFEKITSANLINGPNNLIGSFIESLFKK